MKLSWREFRAVPLTGYASLLAAVLRSELPTASPGESPIPGQSPVLQRVMAASNGRATHEQLSFGYALSSWCLQINSQTLLSLNKPPDLE